MEMPRSSDRIAPQELNSTDEQRVRGELLERLLKTILEEFAETDLFSEETSPTFFLVYAHDAPDAGRADAAIARQLIDWLKVLRAKVFSDRSPRSELWSTREDGVARDILSNQLCLLPQVVDFGRVDNINRVEKVILCCSEVLQTYYKDGLAKAYTEAIKKSYRDTKDPGNAKEVKREMVGVVEKYCDQVGFHHVLTELAFLEIRSMQEGRDHSIIPIKLNGDDFKYLPFFNNGTLHWLAPKEHSASIIHDRQGLHRLLFNLLRRLYEDQQPTIDEIEGCYGKCIKALAHGRSLPLQEDFDKLIFREVKNSTTRLVRRNIATLRTAPKQPGPVDLIPATGQDLALKSLAFPEMHYRRKNTERAFGKTCEWITRHPSYTAWLEDGSGILWIKGKPGSGKSTLMEFLLRDFEKQVFLPKPIQISFFLHGRGASLQKSRLGMYRSLLHQLLRSAPAAAQTEFRQIFLQRSKSEGDAGKDWNWHVAELLILFMTVVEQIAEVQPINIFVDALDEASDGIHSEDTSGRIVQEFHELNDRLLDKKLRSTICFSCRHHPVVADNQGLDICVEDENKEDISVYVSHKLSKRLSTSKSRKQYLTELQNLIVKEAQGVFQWAVLVTDLAIRSDQNGCSQNETKQMLKEIPPSLGEVYKHIIETVIDKKYYPKTLRLMRWVCFAERPLTVREICFALGLPGAEIFGSEYPLAEEDFQPEDEMLKRIGSLSGGLIESRPHERGSIVQFIHQSVNDFLRDGLRIFDKVSGDLIGQGNHQLSLICANYMRRITEMEISNDSDAQSVKTRFPFVDYAAKGWFLHAEKAELGGISQSYLINYSQHCPSILKRWISFYRILDEYDETGRQPQISSTLLHTASGAGLLSVIKCLLSRQLDLEQTDEAGNRALHYACRWGHTQIVRALLDAGVDFQAENKKSYTALERAAANGHEEVVRMLLNKGVDINKQTGDTGNALQAAARKGSKAVVQLLLDNHADVNAQGGHYGNALQAAALGGNQAIVQLLLDHHADVNAQGGELGNALQAAACYGHQAIVQLLLDNHADVNTQGGEFGNALQAAAYSGHQAIIQLLLDNHADVNAQGGDFGNALQAAAYSGHQAIIQLLLDNHADVNAQGGEFGNALQAAAYSGHQAIIQLLLDNHADVNTQGGELGNALQAAACYGHRATVQLLLDNHADVNAQGGEFGNALQAAAYSGHQTIVQLLLDNHADVNAQGGQYGNAHQAAVRDGHEAIVQLLLDNGANMYARGLYDNAIQAALKSGQQDIAQILQKCERARDPEHITTADLVTSLQLNFERQEIVINGNDSWEKTSKETSSDGSSNTDAEEKDNSRPAKRRRLP